MVGKQISGKSFGGCIRYLLMRGKAFIIDSEELRITSVNAIISDFNIQRKMNPNLGKAVGHLVLSWSKEDAGLLDDSLMAKVAGEYLDGMGIRNTQVLVVRHTDREHPHLHIVYNRVDNNGKTISDSNNFKRNVKVCKELTSKYGFHFGQGKQRVNRENLRGKEKVRYFLFDAISKVSGKARTWAELEAGLKILGIDIVFKYKSGTEEIQGASFAYGEVKLKGSEIDRSCSYMRLNSVLLENATRDHANFVSSLKAAAVGRMPEQERFFSSGIADGFFLFLEDLGNTTGFSRDEDDAKKKRRRGRGR